MNRIVFLLIIILSGCAHYEPPKCDFWLPLYNLNLIKTLDYETALKTTTAGTKCKITF
jgi:hypothetical protein